MLQLEASTATLQNYQILGILTSLSFRAILDMDPLKLPKLSILYTRVQGPMK
jgi:hypothetical protein